MLRPRVIPCLLMSQGGLVKSQFFRDFKYIGDPINAVRIFNEKQADELMILDIDATVKGLSPDFGLISKLAAECRMPLCYGGGVTSSDQVARLVDMGVEKVAISSAAIANPSLITKMTEAVGRQSVVVVLDIRKQSGFLNKNYEVCTHNARKTYKLDPVSLALELQDAGAGEIVVNSIDRDGSMQGYDLSLAMRFKQALKVPLTFLGGAGSFDHFSDLVSKLGIVGVAAGSFFVFKGRYRAVLISYPTPQEKTKLCELAFKQ